MLTFRCCLNTLSNLSFKLLLQHDYFFLVNFILHRQLHVSLPLPIFRLNQVVFQLVSLVFELVLLLEQLFDLGDLLILLLLENTVFLFEFRKLVQVFHPLMRFV